MAVKTFTAPDPGPVTFRLDAPVAATEITVSPDARTASAELSGPAEVVDGAAAEVSGSEWMLTLPQPAAGAGSVVVRSAGPGSRVVNVATGGAVVGFQGLTVSGSQSVVMAGGRVVVNGVDITAAGPVVVTPEPVRLAVTLPAGSRVNARAGAGTLAVHGEVHGTILISKSADVVLDSAEYARVRAVSGDITAGTVTRNGNLHSVSGDITVDAAAGPVSADTISGDITVHAAGPVTIDAESVSGDIRVTAAPGTSPDVSASSVSGRVRTTGGPR